MSGLSDLAWLIVAVVGSTWIVLRVVDWLDDVWDDAHTVVRVVEEDAWPDERREMVERRLEELRDEEKGRVA